MSERNLLSIYSGEMLLEKFPSPKIFERLK